MNNSKKNDITCIYGSNLPKNPIKIPTNAPVENTNSKLNLAVGCEINEFAGDSLKTIKLESPRKLHDRCFKPRDISFMLPVAVAESVTAGAVSNALCSEPGSSKFFLGGIIAYNMDTQEQLLGVDAVYAEKNNFANPFTTFTMAKNVTELFQSRIGLSTTGFSLPTFRKANLDNDKCEINVKTPYAYICIYDSVCDTHKIFKVINDEYLGDCNQKVQRAQMQAKVALKTKKIYEDYCKTHS
jgi:hypothetical protein